MLYSPSNPFHNSTNNVFSNRLFSIFQHFDFCFFISYHKHSSQWTHHIVSYPSSLFPFFLPKYPCGNSPAFHFPKLFFVSKSDEPWEQISKPTTTIVHFTKIWFPIKLWEKLSFFAHSTQRRNNNEANWSISRYQSHLYPCSSLFNSILLTILHALLIKTNNPPFPTITYFLYT